MSKGAGTSCCNNIVAAQDDSIASLQPLSLYAEDTKSVSVTFLSDIKERDSERSEVNMCASVTQAFKKKHYPWDRVILPLSLILREKEHFVGHRGNMCAYSCQGTYRVTDEPFRIHPHAAMNVITAQDCKAWTALMHWWATWLHQEININTINAFSLNPYTECHEILQFNSNANVTEHEGRQQLVATRSRTCLAGYARITQL